MKLGIALSGGGIRGVAHTGVLQALEDNDIKIDVIGGTSMGSMIASLYAMGYKPYHIYILIKRYAKEIIGTSGFPLVNGLNNIIQNKPFKITGLRNGENIEQIYDLLASKKKIYNINQIHMPIAIPTVDLKKSKEYVFTNFVPEKAEDKTQYITDITIGKAVRASSSFPAVFTPCNVQKYAFADGGALDNIPVNEVKKLGADKVIAVKFNAEEIDENSNIMDIVMKTIDIMGNKISEENLEISDLILDVYTDKVGLLDFKKIDSCYEYGYNAVKLNLKYIKDLLKH